MISPMDDAPIADNAVPRRAEGALEAQVDGDLVLLGPVDLGFFGTAGEGDHIWRLLDGTRNVGELVTSLEGSFDAPPGVVRAETIEYLAALRAAGLITV